MPVLTFPLALVLVACFTTGAIVTWYLQERRLQRERSAIESQMTRVLAARYEVYETLEQGVHHLMQRLDREDQAQANAPVQAAAPLVVAAPAPLPTWADVSNVPLRSTNPELWDMERTYQRTAAEQLAQLSKQTARTVELMEQVARLETEVAHACETAASAERKCSAAIDAAASTERSTRTTISTLEQRVRTLEPLQSELAIARTSLEELRTNTTTRIRELESELSTTRGSLATALGRAGELETLSKRLEERTGELETRCSERDLACMSAEARCTELTDSLASTRTQLATATGRASELEGKWQASERELGVVRNELASTGSSNSKLSGELKEALDRVIELEAARAELDKTAKGFESQWTKAQRESERLEGELADTRQRAAIEHETLGHELETTRTTASKLETQLGEWQSKSTKLEGELTNARGEATRLSAELDTTRASARDERETLGRELESTRTNASKLETQLGEWQAKATKLEGELASTRNEALRLTQELLRANLELATYREKLSHHSSHVVEAWSMVTSLKPMLEALEQKLKEGEEPKSALPTNEPATSGLSVFDEPSEKKA